jgi:tRNA(Ile)-lysidine synthase TilS/MesJ
MKIRHILGISGGKDSAALAIYLKQRYPELKIEYYNSDTGCELEETELLIDRLEAYLGKIVRLRAAKDT